MMRDEEMPATYRDKFRFALTITTMAAILSSCSFTSETQEFTADTSATLETDVEIVDMIVEEITDVKVAEMIVEEKKIAENDVIKFTIFDNETLSIDKNRISDGSIYGLDHIDRWELHEIDIILNALRGTWEIESYAGFIAPIMYIFPENFFDMDESIRNEMYAEHERAVLAVQTNIPDFFFSIKEHDGKMSMHNNISINNDYLSPISISLSINRFSDMYPFSENHTAISEDFFAEYPVLFIRFFVEQGKEEGLYKEATLVISSNSKFYVLIDGAFYSVKPRT